MKKTVERWLMMMVHNSSKYFFSFTEQVKAYDFSGMKSVFWKGRVILCFDLDSRTS